MEEPCLTFSDSVWAVVFTLLVVEKLSRVYCDVPTFFRYSSAFFSHGVDRYALCKSFKLFTSADIRGGALKDTANHLLNPYKSNFRLTVASMQLDVFFNCDEV